MRSNKRNALAITALLFATAVATLAQHQQPFTYGTPDTQITVLENTRIHVTTDQALSSKRSRDGAPVLFTVSEDVIVDHILVIPRGAIIHGEVVQHKKAGVMSGAPELTLKLTALDLAGQTYPLYTYRFKARGEIKTQPTTNQLGQAAEFGALAGAVVDGKQKTITRAGTAEDLSAGAAAGIGAVEAAQALSPRPVLNIPAESQLDFTLASPISVQPPTQQQAEQLSHRVNPNGPVLYIRGDTP
jgi:hypothetical protein